MEEEECVFIIEDVKDGIYMLFCQVSLDLNLVVFQKQPFIQVFKKKNSLSLLLLLLNKLDKSQLYFKIKKTRQTEEKKNSHEKRNKQIKILMKNTKEQNRENKI